MSKKLPYYKQPYQIDCGQHAAHEIDKGIIIEQGTRAELTKQKGKYYNLVKNHLELN